MRFLTVNGRFWKFMGVKRCGSVSPVCIYVWTIISVKIFHKCDETLLTVTHIAVSVTLT